MPKLVKTFYILAFGGVISALYMLTQKFVVYFDYESSLNIALPGEEFVPFVPQLTFLYVLFYFLPTWALSLSQTEKQLRHMIVTYLIVALIHCVFFLTLPIPFHFRPDSIDSYSHIQSLLFLIYSFDHPINTFPSMHVSFSFLSYFIVAHYKPKWGQVALILAILVSTSTVFVKQHYILDGVSGWFLAWLANRFLIKNHRLFRALEI